MASVFAHIASVLWLFFITKKRLDLTSLLIGCLLPDIEVLLMSIKIFLIEKYSMHDLFFKYDFFRKPKDPLLLEIVKPKLMHSLLGCFFILLPVSLLVLYLVNGSLIVDKGIKLILISLTIGLSSHLILDLFAHRNLPIFYPFKHYEKNPLLFTSTWNYSILSTAISIVIFLYLYKKFI